MASTPMKEEDILRAELGHKKACKSFYPLIFPDAKKIHYTDMFLRKDDVRSQIYDGELCIDYILEIEGPTGRLPVPIYVQERFRNPKKFGRYRDLTACEWHRNSDTKGEVYKIAADFYLYGYYDIEADIITEAVWVNVAELKTLWLEGTLSLDKTDYNKGRKEDFCSFPFETLDELGALYYWYIHPKRELLTYGQQKAG